MDEAPPLRHVVRHLAIMSPEGLPAPCRVMRSGGGLRAARGEDLRISLDDRASFAGFVGLALGVYVGQFLGQPLFVRTKMCGLEGGSSAASLQQLPRRGGGTCRFAAASFRFWAGGWSDRRAGGPAGEVRGRADRVGRAGRAGRRGTSDGLGVRREVQGSETLAPGATEVRRGRRPDVGRRRTHKARLRTHIEAAGAT